MNKKPIVTVCMGTPDQACNHIINNESYPNAKNMKLAVDLAIQEVIHLSHGMCDRCLKIFAIQNDLTDLIDQI